MGSSGALPVPLGAYVVHRARRVNSNCRGGVRVRVPLGTYQIVHTGLLVTAGMSSDSSIIMKLQSKSMVEVVQTCVENGRVRGRICAVVNEDGTHLVVEYEHRGSSVNTASSTGISGDVKEEPKMGQDCSFQGWCGSAE